MRGTRDERTQRTAGRRFIPAYAGNTEPPPSPATRSTVHPRVCGEHRLFASDPICQCGSSPRMRGTRKRARHEFPFVRFIPAYAGNTRTPRRKRRTPTVHPRVCGEHSKGNPHQQQATGSSPRMRGTQQLRLCIQSHYRFIPAYAGNTDAVKFRNTIAYGSSPRMRGTPC